jgi:hypothetical protein
VFFNRVDGGGGDNFQHFIPAGSAEAAFASCFLVFAALF